jgi:putative Ca2+/H+ antiporter (TMEM165/GDT1 family)
MCLSSQTKQYLNLLLGAILAFAVADGIAILLGGFITKIVPPLIIKIISGTIFIIFGIVSLVSSKEEETSCQLKNPFISAFSIILLSEMGDKTQVASGLFAVKFNPLLVFIGVMLALSLLSITALYLGKFITKKLNKRAISLGAGIIFITVGIICFFT